MLAPVNGSDRQFITADSHTAERGPGRGGGGGSPPGTPLEETNPFLPTPGILSRESGYVFAEPLRPGGKTPCERDSVCPRQRQGQRVVTATHGAWGGPWWCPPPCAGVAAPALSPAGWGAGLCHPRGHCCGSGRDGGGWGVPGYGEILPLRLQPATRWVSAAHRPLPASRRGGTMAGERRTGHPEAGGDSPSRRVTGAWPGCGVGPPLGKRYPAGPAPSGADAGLGWQPADTHSLRFDYFLRGRKLD